MSETSAVETLEAFLQAKSWQVEKLGSRSHYRLTIPAGDEQVVGYVLLYPTEFMFYPLAPLSIPSGQFTEAAEYLTRINNSLWTNNFELDYETGQVRCKASFAFQNMPLEMQLVENAIHDSVEAMLSYLPGLVDVLNGTQSPKAAAQQRQPDSPIEPQEGKKAKNLYNTVIQFYQEENWAYRQLYEYYTRITYNGRNRETYFCYATMLAEQEKFLFTVGLQGIPESDNVSAVIEWITWMNYNLKIGYYNYDFSQSAISFINGIGFYGMTPSTQLLKNVIYPTLNTADNYWPYLKQVINGVSPREAMPSELPKMPTISL